MLLGIAVGSLVNLAPIANALLQDKVMHFLAYGLLMGWFAQIFRQRLKRLALVLAFVVFGISIEYLQAMVPYRQFDLIDIFANAAGVLVAWLLSYTWLGSILSWLESYLNRFFPVERIS